jgi:hypothetical protein
MDKNNKTLVFVVCPSYHGATLFSLIMNENSMICSLGDTIPSKLYSNAVCACGKEVHQNCSFWSDIRNHMKDSKYTKYPSLFPEILHFTNNYKLNIIINRIVIKIAHIFQLNINKLFPKLTNELRNNYTKFIDILLKTSNRNIFIDGQKNIDKIQLLHLILGDSVKLKFIHIVRDPRGYFYSLRKRKPNISLKRGLLKWTSKHNKIKGIIKKTKGDHRYLKYEDLCNNPQKVHDEICYFLNIDNNKTILNRINKNNCHVIGNNMLIKFNGIINKDTSWKNALTKKDQTKFAKIGVKELQKYGYVE